MRHPFLLTLAISLAACCPEPKPAEPVAWVRPEPSPQGHVVWTRVFSWSSCAQ